MHEGSVAAVTGSARGIGRTVAEQLAARGTHVLVLDVNDGSGTVEAIEAAGGSAEFVEADVTDAARLEEVFEGRTLSALVNNAALLQTSHQRFDELTEEQWDRMMAVNAKGTFLTSKYALDCFDDGGSIVNLSSDTVTTGTAGFLHYVASKSAIVGMTRSMATELGELGVRVNAVMPGLTASERMLEEYRDVLDRRRGEQTIQRTIEPTDIANAIAFLAGPDSEMITGQVITVNGGYSYQ